MKSTPQDSPVSPISAHPVLTCEEARAFEAKLFGGDESREWAAMQHAGRALAAAVLRDFEEIGGFPAAGRVLVLAGKGHNGGDALLAARAIVARYPQATVDVVFAFGERAVRPLAAQAWRELAHRSGERVDVVGPALLAQGARGYDLCFDGVFGFQFRPPLPPDVAELFRVVEGLSIRLRAAVDLPSGLADDNTGLPVPMQAGAARGGAAFKADFTYATGIVKHPVIAAGPEWVGRLRYLDLGFFHGELPAAQLHILTSEVLAPLARLRAAQSDKRTFGHVMVLGGSCSYPGAVLMTVLAALRSGAGLVTAFVPECLAPAFAARAPEAMWVGWPETPTGGLALEGQHLLRTRLARAHALVIGPGLGRDPETLALVKDVVSTSPLPLVLDADALQRDIAWGGSAPRVLTPHLGEYERIVDSSVANQPGALSRAAMLLKGRLTMITGAQRGAYVSPFGGPVLARGGSGDLLAGIIGALLAQTPDDPLLAACRGAVWHGLAADALARAHGQVAVHTTQLLDFLPAALRESGACPAI